MLIIADASADLGNLPFIVLGFYLAMLLGLGWVGYWRGKEFVFGNYKRNGFSKPTIPVGAPAQECRVEIVVPGYQKAAVTLAPGAKSPTKVTLQR